MICLPDVALDAKTLRYLAKAQKALMEGRLYAEQVQAVEGLWDSRKRTQWFGAVQTALGQMCSGPTKRCLYCEDAPVQGIDHFKPKTIYPELAFTWENFISACQSCNGPKSNHFPLIDCATLAEIEDKRPPLAGQALFINPRIEDPFDFLILDLHDTFHFRPRAAKGTCERLRAEKTIETLTLNTRDYLVEGRQGAFDNYIAHLKDYISERDKGETVATSLEKLRRVGHMTVWQEMQRQWHLHDTLRPLFTEAPEARDKNFLNFTDIMR